MHFYFISRGPKDSVDRFITQLQGKYLPYQWRKSDKDPYETRNLQVGVRPIQLWEVAFPKEQTDLMLTTILGKEPFAMGRDTALWKFVFRISRWLRKLLHLNPIPEKYDATRELPIYKEHISFIPIGLKDDYFIEPQHIEGI